MDLETFVTPCEKGKGRKRLVQPANWRRNKLKLTRHKPKALPVRPTCNHLKKPIYSCQKLTMKIIQQFHQMLFANKDKIKQDTFLLKFIKGSRPRRATTNLHGISLQYFIPNIFSGTSIRVCKKAFLGITGISADRIETIARNFLIKREVPKERRGGNRVGEKNEPVKNSINEFMETLKCSESHYQRQRTSRLFWPCDLNFLKLFKIYKEKKPNASVKISYFRRYVNKNYNLSFGTPLTDVCSTCLRTGENLKKVNISEKEKLNIMTEKRVHTLKAKSFYELLKNDSENVQIMSFDCQKNLCLPKLPDQSAYFSQQINLFNFTVVIGNSKVPLSPQTVRSYIWLESEHQKNSNSIVSAVHHTLLTTNFSCNVEKVQLFADGCGRQNKNSTMMLMLAYWFANEAPTHIKFLEIIFPVVGHSFLPPDRVFGLIERKIKKIDIIVKREEYEEVIGQYSQILRLGQHWQIQDWKAESQLFLKKPGQWHIKFNETKRFIKNSVTIRGELFYRSDIGFSKSVSKRGKRLSEIRLQEIGIGNCLKGDKSSIGTLLKKHYGDNWRENQDLQYFKIIDNNRINPGEDEENEEVEEKEASELRI